MVVQPKQLPFKIEVKMDNPHGPVWLHAIDGDRLPGTYQKKVAMVFTEGEAIDAGTRLLLAAAEAIGSKTDGDEQFEDYARGPAVLPLVRRLLESDDWTEMGFALSADTMELVEALRAAMAAPLIE